VREKNVNSPVAMSRSFQVGRVLTATGPPSQAAASEAEDDGWMMCREVAERWPRGQSHGIDEEVA
jgi:hypothetical protein